jgi:hypothetical protein
MSDTEDPITPHPSANAPHPQPFFPRSGEKGERSPEWSAPAPVCDGPGTRAGAASGPGG